MNTVELRTAFRQKTHPALTGTPPGEGIFKVSFLRRSHRNGVGSLQSPPSEGCPQGGVGSLQSPPSEGCPQGGVGRDVSDIKNRRGMTLVEVMLAATIMGIMSIVVIHALFYPRLLAVSNALRQEAILAGTDALEQIFSQPYNFATPPVNPVGKYVVNGRAITSVITTVDREGTPEYKRITVTVSYPGGGTPIVLETFRCNVN